MALSIDEFSKPEEPDRTPELNANCAQAMSLQLAGDLDRAAQLYHTILEVEPAHAAANYCIGMLLIQAKQAAEGLPHLLAALAAEPQVPDYWLGYLEALFSVGSLQEAQDTLALARSHGLSGRSAEEFAARLSVKLSSQCSTLQPKSPPPTANRRPRAQRRRDERAAERLEAQVLAQIEERQFAPAQQSARRLTRQFPERGLGWKILGALLATDGKADEALTATQEATRRLPNDAEAFCNLGVIYTKLKRWEEAEASLQNAISIDPRYDDSYLHLGFVYASLEKFPEAEAMYRRAVADSKPSDKAQTDMRHSGLVFLLTHNPHVSAAELFAEHCAIGRWLEERVAASRSKFPSDRRPERRLKVGIVSGDLRSHAVANFIEPVLPQLHACEGLELVAFSNTESEDEISLRMRASFAQWHSVCALTDLELVKLIKADAIDILIDLSGHTSFNRLRTFALKPAPIQVSWLGYPGTTGMQAMDYYLADPHFLPPGQFDPSFTEKIVYLPAAWTFMPHASTPPVNKLPALEEGFMTFGSFNRVGKINAFTVALWSRLLRATPNSILVLVGIPPDARRQALTELFNVEGIGSERLAFYPRSDMQTYLALHHQVDLCLDTFPYTGGTTTNHALWMGVPTLTLAGETPASRQCAANLCHLGLQEFIAVDADDFVRKGLEWSTASAALSQIRSSLRERWLKAPLRQPKTIAAGLDAALRHMWRRWCADQPVQSFSINTSNQVCQ